MTGERQVQRHRQISVRVAGHVLDDLEHRAMERAESRNALVERYIAEGSRMDGFPDIYFRDGSLGRRAAILGTRLDVWQVIETLRNSANNVEETASYLSVPESKIRAAVRYYAAYRNEVKDFADRASAIADRAEAAWRAEQEILAG